MLMPMITMITVMIMPMTIGSLGSRGGGQASSRVLQAGAVDPAVARQPAIHVTVVAAAAACRHCRRLGCKPSLAT